MKARPAKVLTSGFTLVEVLIVVAVILVLMTLAIPTKDRSARSTVTACMNNQRKIASGQFMWAADHDDAFPWCVAANKGGTKEVVADGNAAPHFQVLSNYMPIPKFLICPSDTARTESANLTSLSNSNISYFANLDADRGASTNQAQTILTGDRHLQVNGQPVKPGLLVPGANSTIEWTRELHAQNAKSPVGVLSFTDGHAEMVRSKLSDYFQRQHQATNHLAIP